MKRKRTNDEQSVRKKPKISVDCPTADMTVGEMVTEVSWSSCMTANRWKALYRLITGEDAKRGVRGLDLREYCRNHPKLTRTLNVAEKTKLVALLEEMRSTAKQRGKSQQTYRESKSKEWEDAKASMAMVACLCRHRDKFGHGARIALRLTYNDAILWAMLGDVPNFNKTTYNTITCFLWHRERPVDRNPMEMYHGLKSAPWWLQRNDNYPSSLVDTTVNVRDGSFCFAEGTRVTLNDIDSGLVSDDILAGSIKHNKKKYCLRYRGLIEPAANSYVNKAGYSTWRVAIDWPLSYRHQVVQVAMECLSGILLQSLCRLVVEFVPIVKGLCQFDPIDICHLL
jgi:hypothetical protein